MTSTWQDRLATFLGWAILVMSFLVLAYFILAGLILGGMFAGPDW